MLGGGGVQLESINRKWNEQKDEKGTKPLNFIEITNIFRLACGLLVLILTLPYPLHRKNAHPAAFVAW